ncbi:MAG: hypothetical protein J5779_00540 [Clostridia bacterium]|nr:hypothetical protein [Clostridia bacterium]
MGKGIKKGFLTYLFIFIGLIIAAFAVCVVIMIVSPGKQIFGISYFNYNETRYVLEADSYNSKDAETSNGKTTFNGDVEMIEINHFVVNTDNMNVEIVKKSADWRAVEKRLSVQLNLNLRGFVKGKNNNLNIYARFFEDTKTLELNINSPETFINLGNLSTILIELPSNLSNSKTFEVNTTGGSVNLGGNGSSTNRPNVLTAAQIDISTTSGNIETSEYFNLSGASLNSCVKTTSGSLEFSRPIISNNFSFETESGNATFTSETFILTNNFNLKADMSFVEINKINAKNLNLINTNGKIYAGNITGNVIFSEDSANCDIQVKNINGSILIGEKNKETISQTTSVKILESLNGEANIFTKGNIFINNIASGETNIKADGGNVEIVEINATLNISHKNAKITLGKLTDEDDNLLSCEANAKINVIGLNSVVNLYFKNVIDSSRVENTNGKVFVKLTSAAKIDITAKSVKINGESEELADGSLQHVYNSGENTLTIVNANGAVEIEE